MFKFFRFTFELLTQSQKTKATLRVTNTKLESIKFHFKLQTRWLNFYFFAFELLTRGLKNKKFHLELLSRWVSFYFLTFELRMRS